MSSLIINGGAAAIMSAQRAPIMLLSENEGLLYLHLILLCGYIVCFFALVVIGIWLWKTL